MTSFATILDYIQYNEKVVGHNHPSAADTLNRALRTLISASGQDPDGVIQSFAQVFHTHTPTDISAGTFQSSGLYKFIGLVNASVGLTTPYDAGNYPRTAGLNLTSAMSLVGFDCTAASRTAILPTVASVPGQVFTVFKNDASANALVLQAQGGEFIDGVASKSVTMQWGLIQVESNGTVWKLLNILPVVVPATALSFATDAANFPRTTNHTFTSLESFMAFNCTAGALTATLPASAAVTGQIYTVFKTDATANTLTLAAAGGETINVISASKNTAVQYGKIQVIAIGGATATWAQLI